MRRRHAFTLVELLVVIGIIAVLIGILVPTLSRSKDQAIRVQCMNNLRQLMLATLMYAAENKSSMPACNWGTPTTGWLYGPPTFLRGREEDLETGMLWPYLKNRKVYRCPAHGDFRSQGPAERLTSYLMNGGVQNYQGDAVKPRRLSYFKVLDVIYWESGETSLMNNGPPWNDGSSFPGEWLSERHGGRGRKAGGDAVGQGGACFACADGHAEFMTHKEYQVQANVQRVPRPNNRFWLDRG
jgi:prepilin-type N-terminal cleavage/methylation domain-containing protein